ncbi:MAG: alpha/beta hydrolase [Verrucomicrobia bacterium]|nr:alpha/beta hydrolase [Verrucomicrobiota bacterium]
MIPTSILRIWFFGLFSFVLIGAGVYFGHRWYKHAWGYDLVHQSSFFDPRLGFNHATLHLVLAIALLVWAIAGVLVARGILSLFIKAGPPPGESPAPGNQNPPVGSRLGRPDGSELHVESYGPEDAPAIVLIHGWGLDRTEWTYLHRELAGRFRLITWDLPGLGRSTRPASRDYSLDNLARDLEAVLGLAAGQPAVLLGHSIGGMITLTFCKLFPEALGSRVRGLALVHTTYTNPVRTTSLAGLLTALERPLIVPLLHLTIRLAPLVWLMNQLSYLNGSSHFSTKASGFARHATWGQIDYATRLGIRAWPGVLARGMFGMLNYDATQTLKTVGVPALIVAGDRDPVCKPEASRRMHEEISGSQLVTLVNAKHMGLLEQHRLFARHVGEFASNCFHTPFPPPAP